MSMIPPEHRLSIRTEIEDLIATFAYLIDHDLSEGVADLFTPDGSYGRSGGDRSVGRAAITAAYSARKARGTRTARHVFTNLHIASAAADWATGTCILTLYAADGPPPHPAEPLLVADYDDVYQRDDQGRWRFASRTVTHLFTHPAGHVAVLPLGLDRPTR